jgi:hypothetical protein
VFIHFFPKDDISNPTSRHRGFFVAEEIKNRGYDIKTHQPPSHRSAYSFTRERLDEFVRNLKTFAFSDKNDIFFLVRTIYQIDFFSNSCIFQIIF